MDGNCNPYLGHIAYILVKQRHKRTLLCPQVMRRALMLLAVLMPAMFAGCFGQEKIPEIVEETSAFPHPWERADLKYIDSEDFSRVTVNGSYGIDIVRSIYVDVPTITAADGGAGLTGDAVVHFGLWLPVIEGCDWEAAEIPAQCQVPVISEIGPYYDDGDVEAVEPANRLGRFLIENYVPHGYGVAQVSVFGTGNSNHCMDLMGTDEQRGIDAAVEWLGTQPWSNGKVGIIGKSYDGSTPWQAATFGNEHLATIVPMSGLIGVHDLMWRNGSMEARGAIMHNGVYGSFGIDGDADDPDNLCEGYLEGYANGPAAYLTGDMVTYAGNDYWTERSFLDRVIENYNGSIYIIQGMQDWNVDPHMAFPTHQIAEDAGIEIKTLAGQWNHNYPDRPDHSDLPSGRGGEAYPYTLRWDWADEMLYWFDWYLKGEGDAPALGVEIQDNRGGWRFEQTWPALDTNYLEIPVEELRPSGAVVGATRGQITFSYGPFTEDIYMAGMPTLHLSSIPHTTNNGHVFVEMTDDSGMHLGHAVMDLRFHAGGRDGVIEIVPFTSVMAKMEFMPMDIFLTEGESIHFTITQTGEDYVPSPAAAGDFSIDWTESTLTLPLVSRNCDDLYQVPMHDYGEEARIIC
ncbi:MAG TPA: CocE/NonD family hydrolase [Candidatus Poseidoniales archaeon]|nr:CocE/NonD family hydrolase [Candidatus Poseidoniales archaeon]